MKKLITLLIAFMLTASINSYASFTDENGTTRLSYEVTPASGDYVNKVDGPIKIMFTDPLQSKEENLIGKIYAPNGKYLGNNNDRDFYVDSTNKNMYTSEYGIQSFIVDQYGYGTYVIEVDATWVYGLVNGTNVLESLELLIGKKKK